MALYFVLEGQSKKMRQKRAQKKQVDEKSMKVGFGREDAPC